MKSRKFSLFIAVAGALLLTAAFAPRADASLIVYYNFEDATGGPGPSFPANDFTAEGLPEIQTNQQPTLQTNFTNAFNAIGGGTPATGDPDLPNTFALGDSHSKNDNGGWIQFHVNTTFLTNMSLSFDVNTAGNGFATVAFSYSVNGGAFVTVGSPQPISTTGFGLITFAVPAGAEGQTDVVFRLTFAGATSNGNNAQNAIDNIQLNGTVVPEPATVASGLLSVCGLCWHQRRRLIRSIRLRRA
jgi:hypothetical protein